MRNTRKTQFSTADVVHAAQAHDAVVEATLTAVRAAVAVLHPELPLRDVERIATELSKGDRVAYAALCVVCGSVTQERLTELIRSQS